MRALHESVKVTAPYVSNSRSAATTLFNDAVIGSAVGVDCRGFEDIMIIVQLGDIGASLLDFAAGFSDVDDAEDSSFALLSGATFTQITTSDDGLTFVIRIRAKDVGQFLFVQSIQSAAVACFYTVLVALGRPIDKVVSQEQAINFTHNDA